MLPLQGHGTILKKVEKRWKHWKWSFGILLVILLGTLIGLLTIIQNKNIESIFYPFVRQALKLQAEFQFSNYRTVDTKHLVVYYQTPDAKLVPLIRDLAEKDIQKVDQLFSYEPHERIPVMIYPDRSSMQKSFGWSANESAVGVYYGDTIRLLSPRVWLKGPDVKNAPFVHEYTHYVLDQQVSDNFPRWFTEGVAQFAEYKIQGYEWLDSNNSLQQPLYSLQALTDRFDALPNQSLAYRESFMFVKFLIERNGWQSFTHLRDKLASHETFPASIQQTYGSTLTELEKQWQQQIKKEHVM